MTKFAVRGFMGMTAFAAAMADIAAEIPAAEMAAGLANVKNCRFRKVSGRLPLLTAVTGDPGTPP